MTDKPIYVDGVDVSSCDFLAKEDDYCSYSGEYRVYKGECGCSDEEMCKDHPNCFYKKTLKQLAHKTRECEDLKSVRDMWMSRCEQEMKTSEFFQDRFDDLKRTLTEIKEIAEWHTTNADSEDVQEDMKQILQKISEVED